MRHFGSEMGPKSVACDFFSLLILFEASLTFYVDSYALPGSLDNGIDSSLWDKGSGQREFEWSPGPVQAKGADPKGPRQIPQQPLEGINDYEKWQKLLTFDKSKNLSEIDRGPGNESRIIVTSEKEHLEILFESNEEEEENENQLRENIFHLLNSENLLPHLTVEGQSKNLERSKREADEGTKKRRCRCRRVRRRRTGVRGRRRRRRRRRRNGLQNRRRRRRQRRRRRRRCVCRKRSGEDGKTDVEKPEGDEEGDEGGDDGGDDGGDEGGDDGGDEGGDDGGDDGGGDGGEDGGEGDGEEGEGDGEGGEEDGDGEGEEDEGSGEEDEESSSESEEGEEALNNEAGQLISPGGMIPIPPGSMVWVPGPGMPAYPNLMPPPNIMPNVGGIPVGSKP